MDALGKVLEDVVLVNRPPGRDRRAFRVALSAHERNLQSRRRRFRVFRRQNIVAAVTILALRRQLIPSLDGLAVKRLCVQFLLARMTCSALDRLKIIRVRKLLAFKVRVA